MKGLILKDLYMAIKYCKTIFFILIVFLGVSIVGELENIFFFVYPCFIISMLPMTLYAYDEREKWCVYSQTFPVSKAEYVSAKYIFGIIANIIIFIITAAIAAAKMLRNGPFVTEKYLFIMSSIFSISILAAAIILPCIFKWGSEKGRYMYYILLMVAGGLYFGLTNAESLIPKVSVVAGCAGMCIGTLILWCISWRVSVMIYKKRDIC